MVYKLDLENCIMPTSTTEKLPKKESKGPKYTFRLKVYHALCMDNQNNLFLFGYDFEPSERPSMFQLNNVLDKNCKFKLVAVKNPFVLLCALNA